jgi:membrane protein YdbS with pleckstrin-like domain
VLGPLPRLHRWIVCALALVACIGVGAWLAFTLPVPVLAGSGATVGAALGLVVVLLVLHDGEGPDRGTRARRSR